MYYKGNVSSYKPEALPIICSDVGIVRFPKRTSTSMDWRQHSRYLGVFPDSSHIVGAIRCLRPCIRGDRSAGEDLAGLRPGRFSISLPSTWQAGCQNVIVPTVRLHLNRRRGLLVLDIELVTLTSRCYLFRHDTNFFALQEHG